MKQEVINYQFDLIQQQANTSLHFPKTDPRKFRYCDWHLNQIVQQITENKQHTIKWIGNLPNSNILAYFYCVLVGTLKENGQDNEAFVKLKYSLYQVCKQWLSVAEQKTFVEHLCLVEYSKSVTDFLKKSNHLESILVKIFSSHKRQLRNKNRKKRQQTQDCSKLQELQSYSILFPFISFELKTEKVVKLVINGFKFHLIEEKDCIFVIEYSKIRKSVESYQRVKRNEKEKFRNSVNIVNMNEMQTNKKKQNKKQIVPKNIDPVEGQNEEIQYRWLKKPKLLMQNGLLQSVSYPHSQLNVPLVNSQKKNSIRHNSKISEESFTEKESKSEKGSRAKKKVFQKQSPTTQPFTMNNVPSEKNLGKNIKYTHHIRSSVGVQLNPKKFNKMITSKNSPHQRGSGSKSPRMHKRQVIVIPQERVSEINPESNKLTRDGSWYLSQSVDGSQKDISADKISTNKDKKIPTFLQKRKDGILPTDSKYSREKLNKKSKQKEHYINRQQNFQKRQCIIPATSYPILNFQMQYK